MEFFDLSTITPRDASDDLKDQILQIVHDWLFYWQASERTWEEDIWPQIKSAIDTYVAQAGR